MKIKRIFLAMLVAFMGVSFVKGETVIDYHSSLEHTKIDVINAYNASKPTFDYTKSVYVREPILTAPYYEGILQDGVVNDALKQINFYRWLSGLNDVTINEDKMPRSQKGALISAVNKAISHTPVRPEGMSDEFYKDAYAGVYAGNEVGDFYSGNVSWGQRIDLSIKGYIDDVHNVEPNVGHRLSMLDSRAYAVSLGYIDGSSYSDKFGAVSVYIDYYGPNDNNDEFYAFPTAGYFPVNAASSDALWSLTLKDGYTFSFGTSAIGIFYGEEVYWVESAGYDGYYNTVYYSLPTEVLTKIASNGNYKAGETVVVAAFNLIKNGELYNIVYPVSFMDTQIHKLDKINIYLAKNENENYELEDGFKFEVGKEYPIASINVTPSNATFGTIDIQIGDKGILNLDNNTGVLTALKSGSTTITVTDSYTGYKRVYNVGVVKPITSIELNKRTLSLLLGTSETLSVKVLPEDATEVTTYTWKSSDESVATVDQNGKVTAIKEGTVTITVTSKEGLVAEAIVMVNNFAKGDVNKDGKIDFTDVILVLRGYLKLDTLSVNDKYLYDVNSDNVIDFTDVIMVLRTYLGLE